jgi:hypothetical protein
MASSSALIPVPQSGALQVSLPTVYEATDPTWAQLEIPTQHLEKWVSQIPGGWEHLTKVAEAHSIPCDRNHPKFDLNTWYLLLIRWVHEAVNHQLKSVHEEMDMVVEEAKVRNLMQEEALAYMHRQLEGVRKDVQDYAERIARLEESKPEEMEWQPTMEIGFPQFDEKLEETIKLHSLHRRASRVDSRHATPAPRLPQGIHPADILRESEPPSELRMTPPTGRKSVSRQATPQPPVKDTRKEWEEWMQKELDRRFAEQVLRMDASMKIFETQIAQTVNSVKRHIQAASQTAPAPIPIPPQPEQPPPPPPAPSTRRNPVQPAEENRQEGGQGGSGGNGGGRRGLPDGDPDSSSSESDSDSDAGSDREPDLQSNPRKWKKWYKRHQRRLRKARKGKGRRDLSDFEDPLPKESGRGRVERVEPFSGENGKYTIEDFLWNLDCKFQIEGAPWLGNDQDKIRFASSCLTGKARDWFRAYRCKVNPEEARRSGMALDTLDRRYWSWPFFTEQLRRSFGTKDMKDKALKQWEALRHTGTIDEFCDEIERLMWIVDVSQTTIEHKLKTSLKYELAKDWVKLINKPTAIMDQLSLLREMGRPIEDFNKTHKKEEKQGASSSSGNKRKRGEENTQSSSKKPRTDNKSTKFGRFESKEVALQGIPQDILDQRKNDRVCWRCGKVNHKAMECRANAPVTVKVAASRGKDKEKEKKKAAKVSAATGAEGNDQLVVAGSSSRIMELSSEDEMVDA